MLETEVLTLEIMAEYVKKYTKGIGLRIIYNKYGVPDETRPQVNKLWDEISDEIGVHNKIKKKKKKEQEDAETETEGKET